METIYTILVAGLVVSGIVVGAVVLWRVWKLIVDEVSRSLGI